MDTYTTAGTTIYYIVGTIFKEFVIAFLIRIGFMLTKVGFILFSSTLFAGTVTPDEMQRMSDRLAACAACHGERGHSNSEEYFPSLAGKPAGYIYQQLLNFRDGRRHNDVMQQMLTNLSASYLQEIARYYASQRFEAATETRAQTPLPAIKNGQRAEELIKQGDPARNLPACNACHGAALAGARPTIPGLLGLPEAYLQSQLGAWRVGSRNAVSPDCMQIVAKKLTVAETSAVATWLAQQPIPSNYEPADTLPDKLPLKCGAAQ